MVLNNYTVKLVFNILPNSNTCISRWCATTGFPEPIFFLLNHTCDRVAMLQLEICKFLAGDLVS
jgi:hypothetical protein